MFLNSSVIFSRNKLIRYDIIVLITSIMLEFVAFAQEFLGKFAFLPGSTLGLARPQSLTGSYLHYPIILVLLGFILIQCYASEKRIIYGIFGIISFVMCILSFSRSAAFILLGGLCVLILTGIYKVIKTKRIKLKNFYMSLMFIAIVLAFFYCNQNSIYVARIFSALNANSEGNTQRIVIWQNAITLFKNTNIFIGSYTGMFTNSTANFGGQSTVAESGLLQQLLNFGLLGALLYYLLFIRIKRNINKNHVWLKVALIASILESFIYQSIEVLPFMAILCILPLTSDYLNDARNRKRRRIKIVWR
ncbi:O-antigen ligase family protein [Clostridium tyrobutyricum]|uniref:O-antigen ligase family protein n=1 Tax=Clostridium tyrobutyricum TaxID=1519 RepID=UPI001C380FFA|nr:O-antigen ligase family protein [Clostridium tyrobutyricum]MBV4422913.1 O-antigen ligase family protein [Clostridium tyrobutyricum]